MAVATFSIETLNDIAHRIDRARQIIGACDLIDDSFDDPRCPDLGVVRDFAMSVIEDAAEELRNAVDAADSAIKHSRGIVCKVLEDRQNAWESGEK